MKREVCIETNGTQHVNGVEQVETAIAEGVFFRKDDGFFVLYDENPEEGGIVKCRIKYEDGAIEVKKGGDAHVVMLFRVGTITPSDYRFVFGTLHFVINTKSISVNEQEDEITIHIEYEMKSEGQHISQNVMDIVIRPSQKAREVNMEEES